MSESENQIVTIEMEDDLLDLLVEQANQRGPSVSELIGKSLGALMAAELADEVERRGIKVSDLLAETMTKLASSQDVPVYNLTRGSRTFPSTR
jgi:surfactin synthase thioesterase subunit